jgi:hypothetical protein
MWTYRCLIVPDSQVAFARELTAAVAGPAGAGMFTAALSPTGQEPATHWISAGMIAGNFAALLPLTTYMPDAEPIHTPGQHDVVAMLANEAGYPTTAEQVQALFAAADVTEQDPQVVMARLGLVMVQPSLDAWESTAP